MGCGTLSPQLESIFRWTIFGLTCLSWVFVVASTGTCSFVSDSFFDYGLFCLQLGGGRTERYDFSDFDPPGAFVTARLFGTLACLLISAALITVSLVIFILPMVHAVRAWWTSRILFCVALLCVLFTFSMNSDSNCLDVCESSAGSVLNSFNVIFLIALITLSFLIGAPKSPILTMLVKDSNNNNNNPVRPSAPAPSMLSEAPTVQQMEEADDEKSMVVSIQPPHTTRSEEVTPDGHRLIREVTTHADGRQEVTETVEEASMIGGADQTFVTTKEMMLPGGNRMTVEMTKHADGRQEVVETVEEPSMIAAPPSRHIFVTSKEMMSPEGNRMTVETTKHADGRQEVVETVEEPSIIGGLATAEVVGQDDEPPYDEQSMIPIGRHEKEDTPSVAETRASRDPSVIGDPTATSSTSPERAAVRSEASREEQDVPSNRRRMDPPDY